MTAPLAIGDGMPPRDLCFDQRDTISAYLRAAGDDNPLHSDSATARRAGFADVIVPGMLIMGQIASAVAAWSGPRVLCDLTARFVEPVVFGATVTVAGRVVALRADGAAIMRITAGPPRRPHVLAEAVIAPPLAPNGG